MLAKKYRLPIQKVFKERGRSARTAYFSVKVFPSKNNLYSRYGVIVSKKVFSKASERNSLRRAIFSKLNPKYLPSKDFLIVVSPNAKNLKKTEIPARLKEAFNKINKS